jgi:hypothetical protein
MGQFMGLVGAKVNFEECIWSLIVRHSMEVHIAHGSDFSDSTVIFGDCHFASHPGRDVMTMRLTPRFHGIL